MNQRVLIVEDDVRTAQSVSLYLRDAGFDTTLVHDGRGGLDRALAGAFDLIVLDLMLPGLDGHEICRRVRREAPETPILVLTARTEERDLVESLEVGADDYMPKPFSPRELVARARAVLRRRVRQETGGQEVLEFPGLRIDLARHEVRCSTKTVALTPIEFRLLSLLATRPGQVFSRSDMIERVYGHGYYGSERTIDAHIKNIRRKLGDAAARFIETVFGVGYRFATDV